MILSNESGCAGASLSQRFFGETIDYLLFWREYWFASRFNFYRNNEKDLPFDQQALLALCAPRPLCVGSADRDVNSDPYGEYLSALEASKVYALFGANGIRRMLSSPPGSGGCAGRGRRPLSFKERRTRSVAGGLEMLS